MKVMGGLLAGLLLLASPLYAEQFLKVPIFKDGQSRAIAVHLESVPESFEQETVDYIESPGSSENLTTRSEIKIKTAYELDQATFGMWYNDGDKNKFIDVPMYRRAKGQWVSNFHRSLFFPSGKWFGNIYKVQVQLEYQNQDNTKSLVRIYSTKSGDLLYSLRAATISMSPAELLLNLQGVDPLQN